MGPDDPDSSQASLVVYLLGVCSIVNAIYTFSRKRHYRLFEATVEVVPSTPSARRVRVESSPSASSPMRYLNRLIDMTKAESRAYPDSVRDVWEVTIWDPKPLCLALFCLFSPGHVLVYCLFLPSRPLDPRPSVTVLTTMSLAALFSALLVLMKNFFTQQAKDAALINKEVAREYDTKFVHPSLNKPVRDVGTQMIPAKYTHHIPEVETYTPTTYVNRGFYVSPNPNYAPHFNPDGLPQDSPRAQRSVVGTPLRHAPSMAGANDLSASYRATPTPAMRLQASGNALRECGLAKRQSSPLKHSSAPADGSEAARGNGIAPLRRATEGFHVRRH